MAVRLPLGGDKDGYGGSGRGGQRVCPELRNENLPDGHEQYGERGPRDETAHAEKDKSPQRGQQHEEVRQLGVPADKQRAENIVGEADHGGAVYQQDAAVPVIARKQKVDGHGPPDERRAHNRDQRQCRHDHAP